MTELTLELLRQELAPIRSELALVSARTDGLPLIGSAIEVLRRDMRMLRAAINDMNKTNVTAGEIEALHNDLDRVQTELLDIGARLLTTERLLKEERTK